MPVPMRQAARMGAYLMEQKLKGNDKFPLIVELEPLFQCNLACEGCGKIQHPLIHPEIDEIVRQLIARKKFIYLCTNALLLEKKLDLFKPSPYFSWAIHMDGLRERHDESVSREGVFDKAVAAIRAAKKAGFRVTTNTTFFTHDTPETVRSVLDFLNDDLEVDQMMISPAYAYEKAPDQEHFLGVRQTRELFSAAFSDGRRKRWRLNHSPIFLDFLEGKVDLQCTAWGIPSYSLFGWQKPCYLMADGYVSTYRELLESTDWDAYGRGKDPRCDNCMAHCGYEPTAVTRSTGSIKESLRAAFS
jgi:hopanoid biosynthesis associated radical SAM protein HpnH